MRSTMHPGLLLYIDYGLDYHASSARMRSMETPSGKRIAKVSVAPDIPSVEWSEYGEYASGRCSPDRFRAMISASIPEEVSDAY